MPELNNKPRINFLVFWVGQFCTLRCKNCCNLIPYTKNSHYDMKKSIIDLKKLSHYAQIQSLQIQGGEPFTHPDLHLLITALEELPIANIEIATNGTMLLTGSAIEAIKKTNKIKVRVSNYPHIARRKEKFVQQLADNNIALAKYDFMYGDQSWFDSGSIDVERNDDEESVRQIYRDCENKVCWTLADGTLTTCGKIPALKELRNIYDKVPYNEIDIRNISSKDEMVKSIAGFMEHMGRYKEACRYCLGTYKKIPSAIQIGKEELSECLIKLPALVVHN